MEKLKQISNPVYKKKFEPSFRVAFQGNDNRKVTPPQKKKNWKAIQLTRET